MSFHLRSDKSRQKFEHYVRRLLSLFDEREAKLTGPNIGKFELDLYVLHNLIECDKSLTSSRLRLLIETTLFEMKKQGITDESSFFKVLDSMHLKSQGEKASTFNVVCSINLDIDKLPNTNFAVNGREIRIINYVQLERDFGIITFPKVGIYDSREISQLRRLSYSVIEVDATGVDDAYRQGHEKFELFRGILNLAEKFGIFTHQYGRPKILSRIQPSRLTMVFDQEKKLKNYWLAIGLFDYQPESLTRERMDFAVELIDRLGSLKDSSLKNRLISTIIRYNEGLDGNITGTSFISFWQLLEIIALGDYYSPMSEKEVSNRIGVILNDETMRDLLNALRDRRNDLVHDGLISEFDLQDVNFIKLCCEHAILFLLDNIDSFEDEPSLDLFYKLSDKNDTDLARERKVLEYLKKNRVY